MIDFSPFNIPTELSATYGVERKPIGMDEIIDWNERLKWENQFEFKGQQVGGFNIILDKRGILPPGKMIVFGKNNLMIPDNGMIYQFGILPNLNQETIDRVFKEVGEYVNRMIERRFREFEFRLKTRL